MTVASRERFTPPTLRQQLVHPPGWKADLAPVAHHRALFGNLRAQCLAEHVEKVVKQFPPLTGAQLDRIAALLRSGSRDGAGGDAA